MKIGLVAMSGIRACDEELLALGLTLPGFVERSKVVASLPSLGLLTLAGMTDARHEVTYLEIADLSDSQTVQNRLDDFDLVGISSYSAQIGEAYTLGDRLREKGITTVIGGLHATAVPAEAKQHCDAVAVGEGELIWNDILWDWERGELKPYYGYDSGEFDLAETPMPAFELLDIDAYNRLTVQTSRGCIHRCEFCASSTLLTKHYKQKPFALVLAEVDRICSIWEHPFLEFADDNTFVDKHYWKALLPELKKRKFRWFTETDLSIADDPDLLKLMRESGCAQVLIGLESPFAKDLNGLETKQDWKRKQWPRYQAAIHAIQSHGISVNGCFILGLDGQGPDIFDRVFDFVTDTRLTEVQITLQTPFPGTPLFQRLQDENRIVEVNAWEKCTLFDINFIPDQMSVDELSTGFKELGAKLYSLENTRTRKNIFKRYYKESLRVN